MIGNDKQKELEIKKAKQTEYKLQLDNQKTVNAPSKKISPVAGGGGGRGGNAEDEYYYHSMNQGQQQQQQPPPVVSSYPQKSQIPPSSYSDFVDDPAYHSNPYSDRSYQVCSLFPASSCSFFPLFFVGGISVGTG
jgi:hypothetical protein